MVKPTIEVLEVRIEQLAEMHEKNAQKIVDLEIRLSNYDKLAAKWGGVLMFATMIGTFIMTFFDRIAAFFTRASQ